jgi:hypothetical protein
MGVIDYKKQGGLERTNMSGVHNRIWIAPLQWFTAIKDYKKTTDSSGTISPADLCTIDGRHSFVEDKGFIELYTTQDTGALVHEPQPNIDQTGANVTFTAMIPGNSATIAGILFAASQDEWIVLVEDTNGRDNADVPTGELAANEFISKRMIYQLGADRLPAHISYEFNTQTLTGDRKGYSITI